MTQLPKIVSARLAATMGSPEHPDADLLTAFAERTLAGREREQVLLHLSACAQCRQVIALAVPEFSLEAPSLSVPASTRWFRAPVLRWGALAACLVVVAGTVLIQKREQSSHNKVQIAMERAPATPEAIQPPSTAPATEVPQRQRSGAEGTLLEPEAKAKTSRVPTRKSEPQPQQLVSSNRPDSSPPGSVSANAAASDLMRRSENVEVAAEAATPRSAPSTGADQQLRARNSAAVAKTAPVFTPRPSTETAASTMGGAAKLADLRSPSWRLSKDGLPERSFGSGQWEKVQVDHKTGFRAVAALGMEVWIGGPGGLLYHSDDMGLNWTRMIPVSSSATLTDDVTAIVFADHLHGKLATAGGQTWVTSDAGKTWELQ